MEWTFHSWWKFMPAANAVAELYVLWGAAVDGSSSRAGAAAAKGGLIGGAVRTGPRSQARSPDPAGGRHAE